MNLRDLFEAPISDVSIIGNWDKSSSFRDPRDRKLLQNPKAITKMKGQWKFPEETTFNVICINSADANANSFFEGMVTTDWLQTKMPRDWPQIEPLLDHDNVNLIYTNNKGGQSVPLTGWMMAHRFAHALEVTALRQRDSSPGYYFSEACKAFYMWLKEVCELYRIPIKQTYGMGDYRHRQLSDVGPLKGLLKQIGTVRSTRENLLANPLEYLFEMFAQYVFTGEVKFNAPPRGFRYGHHYYGFSDAEDVEIAERHLETLADELKQYFEAAAGFCDGRIFVI